jgi:hypothetical protein
VRSGRCGKMDTCMTEMRRRRRSMSPSRRAGARWRPTVLRRTAARPWCCWRYSCSSRPGSPWTSCATCDFGSADDASYNLLARGPPPVSPNIPCGIWGHGLAGEALPF